MRDYSRQAWARTSTGVEAPLPPLTPYPRCSCGKCQECLTNAKWDKIFAKFEVREEDNWETRGLFQSTLRGW
jgi:hypothetical protein